MSRKAVSLINWAALAERCPESQKNLLSIFRTRSDQYLRQMMANPENQPKIDWSFYKKNITLPGLADKFQKEYESLSIPYPVDNYTASIEEQEKRVMAEVKQFIDESNKRIDEYKAQKAKEEAIIPFEEMTMEDFRDAYPDQALDPINRPTLWPHNPEDQLDYVDEASKEANKSNGH